MTVPALAPPLPAPLLPVPPPALAPLRTFYFLSFGALGALFPFLPLLLAARGLSAVQVSLALALIPASNLVMPPLWGTLADALQARVRLLRLASFVTSASVLLLLPAGGFGWSLFALAAFASFRAPLTALADAATYAAMPAGKGERFGLVRVWGSVGAALFGLAVGLLQGSRRPRVLLGLSSAAYLGSALATLQLTAPPIQREPGVVRGTLALLGQPELLSFTVAGAAYYFGHALYDAFFSLHLRSRGFTDSFVGVSWFVAVTAEIVVLAAAPRLLRHTPSAKLLVVSSGAALLRWNLLPCLRRARAILAQQILHGLTFGLWYAAMVHFVQTAAPERLRTSAQSAVWSALGAGTVLGYLAGGPLFRDGGGLPVFRLAALAACLALLLYGLTAWQQTRRNGGEGRRRPPPGSPAPEKEAPG